VKVNQHTLIWSLTCKAPT